MTEQPWWAGVLAMIALLAILGIMGYAAWALWPNTDMRTLVVFLLSWKMLGWVMRSQKRED